MKGMIIVFVYLMHSCVSALKTANTALQSYTLKGCPVIRERCLAGMLQRFGMWVCTKKIACRITDL